MRIKSILNKYEQAGGSLEEASIKVPVNKDEKDLMMVIGRFPAMVRNAYDELAPHKICAYIYEMANAFNHFYHETKILTEEDADKKAGYIALLKLTKEILETCIDLLGFDAPERM